ncbi:hypothetical protein V1VFAS_075 [Rhizobium phage V1VFA-S]|nr:hypothetical protein V1VFAS_075 [Rhizobium phage V1VFA-S]
MRMIKAAIAALTIPVMCASIAVADDERDAEYNILLNTVSRMRITSENCHVRFDDKYDRDFLAAVGDLNLDVGKVTQDLIDYYKAEKGRSGDRCFDGQVEHLATLDRIFRRTLADFQKN